VREYWQLAEIAASKVWLQKTGKI